MKIEVNGINISYDQAGTGPPLVLLHGALDDSRGWRMQLEGLAEQFTVWAWDAPGSGRSSDPVESWRMPDYADCLVSWLSAVGVQRPHILGLSWGSTLALELYRRHPQVPRSLILASAYAGWAGSLPADVVSERLKMALHDSRLPAEEVIRRWLPSLLSTAVSADLTKELVAIWSDNVGIRRPIGRRTMFRAMAEADLRDVLPKIKIPTLLVYGELDKRSPLQIAYNLHSSIPDVKLITIPGVGHLGNIEAPEQFNSHVKRFITDSCGEN